MTRCITKGLEHVGSVHPLTDSATMVKLFMKKSDLREGDAEFLRRCREGDQAAFREFYVAHRRMVAASLFRVMGHHHELEDLAQDVFTIAFRGFAKFRGESKLSTWLYRICVNVALGRLRQKARRPSPVPMAFVPESAPEDSPETPEHHVLQNERIARVYRILDTLAPKKRLVLVLHEIEGLDIKEIAAIVNVPVVTVRTRLHYARKDFYRRVAHGVGA